MLTSIFQGPKKHIRTGPEHKSLKRRKFGFANNEIMDELI